MICLTMIVRNEAQVLPRALASAIPSIDSWLIVDTGSTDGTPELAADMLKALPGRVEHRPWQNFGVNRSESLELAREREPDHGQLWHLILDGDEELIGTIPPLDPDVGCYALNVSEGGTAWWSWRLLRADLRWRYVGDCHSIPEADTATSPVPLPGVRIVHHNDGGNKHGRREQNIELLSAAVRENPQDARSWFYLAQEYADNGEVDNACAAYFERTRLGGWHEEIWYSHLQRGKLLPYGTHDLERAYELMPHRLESVYWLARQHRERGLDRTAHLWARHGAQRAPAALTRAREDQLFVAEWIYAWGIHHEHLLACLATGRVSEAAIEAFSRLRQHAPPEVLSEARAMIWS